MYPRCTVIKKKLMITFVISMKYGKARGKEGMAWRG
jgi:hypothetical protein